MAGMALRIAESSRDALVAELTDSDGSRSLIRLSAPAVDVFRLQAADANGRFHEHGVSQFLAGPSRVDGEDGSATRRSPRGIGCMGGRLAVRPELPPRRGRSFPDRSVPGTRPGRHEHLGHRAIRRSLVDRGQPREGRASLGHRGTVQRREPARQARAHLGRGPVVPDRGEQLRSHPVRHVQRGVGDPGEPLRELGTGPRRREPRTLAHQPRSRAPGRVPLPRRGARRDPRQARQRSRAGRRCPRNGPSACTSAVTAGFGSSARARVSWPWCGRWRSTDCPGAP